MQTRRDPIVFLVDVDNTLLDNDGIQQDLKDHIEQVYGCAARERYWRILEDRFAELGYREYIGALQRYRVEHPREVELLPMSSFLIDYPFADRLYPGAIEVLKRLKSFGPTVILSDGDVGCTVAALAGALMSIATSLAPFSSRALCLGTAASRALAFASDALRTGLGRARAISLSLPARWQIALRSTLTLLRRASSEPSNRQLGDERSRRVRRFLRAFPARKPA
jgi:plasmid stabilization system protein ParE